METEFKKFGENFKMIERTENIAIFKRDSGFEVIKIRVQKKDSFIGGKLIRVAGVEYYPSNEDFGTYGWCYSDYLNAITKYNYLIVKMSEDFAIEEMGK